MEATVRVMTWNVENLFLPGTEDGPSDETSFAAKLDALEAVLRAQTPDVAANSRGLDALRGRHKPRRSRDP
jgi:hypothetical protein